MSGDFLDTNVFIYLFDETDPRKSAIAREIVGQALESGNSTISYQVVQEVLHLLTTKFASPSPATSAAEFFEAVLRPLCRVMSSMALFESALRLQVRYRYRLYDSLVIAAALQYGCNRLISEDLQHGQRIESLTIVNPFAA